MVEYPEGEVATETRDGGQGVLENQTEGPREDRPAEAERQAGTAEKRENRTEGSPKAEDPATSKEEKPNQEPHEDQKRTEAQERRTYIPEKECH
jgi:hypothetical protein